MHKLALGLLAMSAIAMHAFAEDGSFRLIQAAAGRFPYVI